MNDEYDPDEFFPDNNEKEENDIDEDKLLEVYGGYTKQITDDLADLGDNYHKLKKIWNKLAVDGGYYTPIDKKDIYHELHFYTLVSQFLKNIKIVWRGGEVNDGRLNLLVIMPSASGKDRILTLDKKIIAAADAAAKQYQSPLSDILSKKYTSINEFTIQGLAGTIYETPPIVDKNTKEVSTKVIYRYGVFSTEHKSSVDDKQIEKYDFIFSEEARQIFSANRSDLNNIRTLLIQSAESMWKENNIYQFSYKAGILTVKMECSWIFTSVPTSDFSVDTVESGLLRRVLVWYNRPTIAQTQSIAEHEYDEKMNELENEDGIKPLAIKEAYENRDVENFAKMLTLYSSVINKFPHNYLEIIFDSDAVDTLRAAEEQQYKILEGFPDNVQEHLRGIIQTYYRKHALVIASHIAILSASVEKTMGNQVVVKGKHIEEAINIVTNVFSRLPALLSEIYRRDKNADSILLNEEISEKWKVDEEKILKKIKDGEKDGKKVAYQGTVDNIVENLIKGIETKYKIIAKKKVKDKIKELEREGKIKVSKNGKTIGIVDK